MTDEIDALIAENKRLGRELRELRQRVRAFETSRWHRLHPRRLISVQRPPGKNDAAVWAPAAPLPAWAGGESQIARFRDDVVRRGAFSQDWLTEHVGAWEPLLRSLAGRRSRILEIGSFEGLSACYLLWRLPEATITCVDTFDRSRRESIFDANVELVDASRVRKLVGDSRRVLPDLVAERARFDLVYVDGSHLGLDVLVDAAHSWRLLEPGGALVFDDYRYREKGEDALLRPGPAIDAFLAVTEGKYEPLFRGHQVAVRKLRLRSTST